jgi:primosomal protein N' (replication factor Y)
MTYDHYGITCAASHDYDQFYQKELAFRQELGYPPFGFLAAVRLTATSEAHLSQAAEKSAGLLRALKNKLGLRTEILGPAPAPLYRLRGRFRQQILLKDASRVALRRLLTAYRHERILPAVIREALDIDPVDLM